MLQLSPNSNYFVWEQLINVIILSNERCDTKTTKKIVVGIMTDLNNSNDPNPFFKCKIEQMLFLYKTLSFLGEKDSKPLKDGIAELCHMCKNYVYEKDKIMQN